jgi:hypothetical protein
LSLSAYADEAAALLGIPLEGDLREAVAGDLERIRAIAEFLMEFPLAQGVEPAAVFRP